MFGIIIAINFDKFSVPFSSRSPKTSEIHLHALWRDDVFFFMGLVDSSPNIINMVVTINLNFDLVIPNNFLSINSEVSLGAVLKYCKAAVLWH